MLVKFCWKNVAFLLFAFCNAARMPLIVLLGASKVTVGLAGFAMDSMLSSTTTCSYHFMP